MSNYFDKNEKVVVAYIKPLLDENEKLETYTITQAPGLPVGLILALLSGGVAGNLYATRTLICLTSKRLVISVVYITGSYDKMFISPTSEPSEIINVPFSEISRIQFKKGIFVGKLIVDIREKGEFQYGFPSRPPARRAQKIASMISSIIHQA